MTRVGVFTGREFTVKFHNIPKCPVQRFSFRFCSDKSTRCSASSPFLTDTRTKDEPTRYAACCMITVDYFANGLSKLDFMSFTVSCKLQI